jgi:hypothetical protein
VDDARPVLRCLIYRYLESGREFKIVLLSDWCQARDEFLLGGWRFIGVDPADEHDLTVHEGVERSRLLKRK